MFFFGYVSVERSPATTTETHILKADENPTDSVISFLTFLRKWRSNLQKFESGDLLKHKHFLVNF